MQMASEVIAITAAGERTHELFEIEHDMAIAIDRMDRHIEPLALRPVDGELKVETVEIQALANAVKQFVGKSPLFVGHSPDSSSNQTTRNRGRTTISFGP